MTCPDLEQLIDGEPAALEHAESCPSCRARLELFDDLREGLAPPVDVPAHLHLATLRRLEQERAQTGIWGKLVTFVLAGLTCFPVIWRGYSVEGPGAVAPLTPMLLILVTAAVITLIEGRFVEEA